MAIHNWLMNTEVRYVLMDLQDEKEICPALLEEIMQLARRLRIPFLFVGVMDKPRRILEAYDFTKRWPTFVTPEDAVFYLNEKFPGSTRVSLDGLEFGVAIATSRARNSVAVDADGAEADAAE